MRNTNVLRNCNENSHLDVMYPLSFVYRSACQVMTTNIS